MIKMENEVIEIEQPKQTERAMPMVYDRIAQIIKDMPAIGKDRENQSQKFNYRGIDEVANAVHPLLAKHRVFFTPHITKTDRQILDRLQNDKVVGKQILVCIEVEYKVFCADDQSYITVGPILGEAVDYGDKACNKAMSMALKYMLSQLFLIAFAEFDTDADEGQDDAPPTPKSSKLLNKPMTLMTEIEKQHMANCYKLFEKTMLKDTFKQKVWDKFGKWPKSDSDDEDIAKGL